MAEDPTSAAPSPVGYARVSGRIPGDIREQVAILLALGVHSEHLYTDVGMSGRPALVPSREAALNACTPGGVLIVSSLARLASSPGELRNVLTRLYDIGCGLQVGEQRYNREAMAHVIAGLDLALDLQADLIRLRTADRLAAPAPEDTSEDHFALTPWEEDLVAELFIGGKFQVSELAAMFGVGRASVYRIATPKGTPSTRDTDTDITIEPIPEPVLRRARRHASPRPTSPPPKWGHPMSPSHERTLKDHDKAVLAVAITPDGTQVISGGMDKTVRVWDLASGRVEHTLHGHAGPVTAVGITPDGNRIITGSRDRTIRIWDRNGGRLERTLRGHVGSVLAVVASPDGQRIVSGALDRTVRVWDLNSGCLEHMLSGHTRPVRAVAVTADGRTIISGGSRNWFGHDDTVRLWSLEGGVLERTLEGHTDTVIAVAVTPDGQQIITASHDRTVRIWDLTSGDLILRTLKGHTGAVAAMAVTPDGQRIATAGLDGTMAVWDLATGTQQKCWDVRAVQITCYAVLPGDPTTFVYGNQAGQVVIPTPQTCPVCDTVDLANPMDDLIDRVNSGQMRYIRGDVPLEDMDDLAASDMKYTIVSYLQCLECGRTRFWGLCIRGAPIYRVADPNDPNRRTWDPVPPRALWKPEQR